MAPSSHAANPQRARRVVRGKTVGLACTLFLACIGLANSDGSQHSLRQYRYVALRGGGGAAPSIPDLVADAATGLSLRDALLHTTAGTGQQPEDPGERPAGTLAGEAGAVRVEVTGRHCAGDIDPLCVSRSRNITLVMQPSETLPAKTSSSKLPCNRMLGQACLSPAHIVSLTLPMQDTGTR